MEWWRGGGGISSAWLVRQQAEYARCGTVTRRMNCGHRVSADVAHIRENLQTELVVHIRVFAQYYHMTRLLKTAYQKYC